MKKQVLALCLFFAIFALSTSACLSAPIINEFSSGTSSDWVEIYNPGADTADLSQYKLRDFTSTNKLDLSGSLSPSGFASFDWSNKLNNAGDLIKLVLSSDESIIDQITYGDQGGIAAPGSGQSGGRKPDGASEWAIFTSSSKNSSNNSSYAFSPPTPTPTKTPTQPKSPTPTKVPAKTSSGEAKTPTPKISPITNANTASTKINSSAKIAHNSKIASDFASLRNLSKTPSKKADKVAVLSAREENFSVLIILGGLVLLAGAAWFGRNYLKDSRIYEKIFNK